MCGGHVTRSDLLGLGFFFHTTISYRTQSSNEILVGLQTNPGAKDWRVIEIRGRAVSLESRPLKPNLPQPQTSLQETAACSEELIQASVFISQIHVQ